ncbi:hypothetical protein C8R44DRAFT_31361 [Mycena epipterygia]|nr:hypothetical protein C8R44DRAFT_31361 [Mycena epipterygia]
MPTLPGELVDSIIDSVALDSPSSLAACALVCRQWVSRTRYHCFPRIHLTRDRDVDTVKPFLHLLWSPLVTFTSSVREVRLHYRSSYATPVLSAGDIILLLSRFGVHPARLDLNCQFDQLGMKGAQPNSFASVTHLGLALSKEIPFGSFPRYLATFPALQSLSLAVLYSWAAEAGQFSSVSTSTYPEALPPNLHKLELNHSALLRWLLWLDVPPQISTLVLRDLYPSPQVNEYLANPKVSGALTSLTLHDRFADLTHETLDLSHLAALRRLHIHQHASQSLLPTATATLALLTRISRSPDACPLLETVELTSNAYEFARGQIEHWRGVDTILAGPLWPRLRRVMVRVCSAGSHHVAAEATITRAVQENLPLCAARGILDISCHVLAAPNHAAHCALPELA